MVSKAIVNDGDVKVMQIPLFPKDIPLLIAVVILNMLQMRSGTKITLLMVTLVLELGVMM